MVALVEAYGTINIPLDRIRILSLGTTDAVPHRRKRLNFGGLLLWAKPAVDVIMRGQSIAAHNQASFLVGADDLVRLNPPVVSEQFTLDGVHRADDLIAKAAHYSRTFMPTFKSKFAGHRASEFVPVYQ
jgi:hypothetical protein